MRIQRSRHPLKTITVGKGHRMDVPDYDAEAATLDACRAAEKTLPPGTLRGRVVCFQTADSYACYLIVSQKPLTLECLTSDYQVNLSRWTLADVREHLRRQDAINALFA